MKKEKIHLEYVFEKASKSTLWNHLTTSSGLSAWFAEDVLIKENNYSFIWNKTPMEAQLLAISPNNKVRFKWMEDENPDSYFEFKLHTDELTRALVLEITDFVESSEKEDILALWNSQVGELKRILCI